MNRCPTDVRLALARRLPGRGDKWNVAIIELIVSLMFLAGLGPAEAEQRGTAAERDAVVVRGTLSAIQIDSRGERFSPGTLVVGAERIAVPPLVFVELPGDTLTLQELFVRAPTRCRNVHESGLVPSDACRRPARDEHAAGRVWTVDADDTPRTTLDPVPTDLPPDTIARVEAIRTADGLMVATKLALTRTDASVWGAVTFVNEEEGYLRVNGAYGRDAGGAIVRINDPDARHSVQSGTGCGQEGNCSPDVRFKVNTVNVSVRFEAGYPACVPGAIGATCLAANRPVHGLLDGNVMLPIVNGDHVTARGGFEVHDGVRVFWAHTLIIHTSPISDP